MATIVEVFRTNVQTEEQSVMLLTALSSAFPFCKLNFDLDDCEGGRFASFDRLY